MKPRLLSNCRWSAALFAAFKAGVAQQAVTEGDEELAADALFNQVYVDKTLLPRPQALQTRHQISLADLVKSFRWSRGWPN